MMLNNVETDDDNEYKGDYAAMNRRTRCGFVVKVRLKFDGDLLKRLVVIACILVNFYARPVKCNRPPRFLIDGQSEIVLRLKEGDETPIGNLL